MIEPIREGTNKKWQITTHDPEQGLIEWIGHNTDTRLWILMRKVNEIIRVLNRLEKVFDSVPPPPIGYEGDDCLDKR